MANTQQCVAAFLLDRDVGKELGVSYELEGVLVAPSTRWIFTAGTTNAPRLAAGRPR